MQSCVNSCCLKFYHICHAFGSHLGPVTGQVLVLIKCEFYCKFCVCSGKYVFIIVKTKCANSGDIFTNTDKHCIKSTHILQFWTLVENGLVAGP